MINRKRLQMIINIIGLILFSGLALTTYNSVMVRLISLLLCIITTMEITIDLIGKCNKNK